MCLQDSKYHLYQTISTAMSIAIKVDEIIEWAKNTQESICSLRKSVVRPMRLYYISIKKDWSVTAIEDSIKSFIDAEYGIVLLSYEYLVQTQYDMSFFTLFITQDGANESVTENGWTLKLSNPTVSTFRSNERCCSIFKGDLCLTIDFLNDYLIIPRKLRDCFKLFKAAQQCTTQRELNFLKELYNKNNEIEALNKRLLNEKMDLHYKEMAIEGYKDLLNQIRDLVGQKKQ